MNIGDFLFRSNNKNHILFIFPRFYFLFLIPNPHNFIILSFRSINQESFNT